MWNDSDFKMPEKNKPVIVYTPFCKWNVSVAVWNGVHWFSVDDKTEVWNIKHWMESPDISKL